MVRKQMRAEKGKALGVIVLLALSAAIPFFVRDEYFLNIGIVSLINCIMAVVLLPVFNSGMLCMASGGFMAIGAYASALLVMKSGLSFWIAFPASGIVASLAALIVAIPTLRIKGLHFMLITFGLTEVVALALKNWRSLTGGADGISGIPSPDIISVFGLRIDFASRDQFYWFALIFAAVVVLAVHRLWASRIGKICLAIEESDGLAQSVGINVFRHKVIIFISYAFITGLAGAFYGHYYNFLSPADFSIWASILPIFHSQVGGLGSIGGPVIGSIVLTIIPELTRSLSTFQPIVFGAIIIIIMRFFPEGIIGIINRVWAGLMRHLEKGIQDEK